MTGGTHTGVMKHVGEAVRDYTIAHGNKAKVVTIGIAPWGCVNNKDILVLIYLIMGNSKMMSIDIFSLAAKRSCF